MEILRTENLTKIYGTGENAVRAVDNVSLCVQKGEFVAIVGASGSGKSTLMHLMDIGAMNADKLAIFRRRQIGIVYQFYNLIPILTAEENILLPWDLDGRAKDENRLSELLDALHIADKRNSLPNELSGGQQQRVSIARALINHPALLLCDEPTGNLDSKATEDIMQILRLANQAYHQTIVMITHNLEIAKDADRIIHIQDGRLEEV